MKLKGAILPFTEKGELDSASNYRGITLIAVIGSDHILTQN